TRPAPRGRGPALGDAGGRASLTIEADERLVQLPEDQSLAFVPGQGSMRRGHGVEDCEGERVARGRPTVGQNAGRVARGRSGRGELDPRPPSTRAARRGEQADDKAPAMREDEEVTHWAGAPE